MLLSLRIKNNVDLLARSCLTSACFLKVIVCVYVCVDDNIWRNRLRTRPSAK